LLSARACSSSTLTGRRELKDPAPTRGQQGSRADGNGLGQVVVARASMPSMDGRPRTGPGRTASATGHVRGASAWRPRPRAAGPKPSSAGILTVGDHQIRGHAAWTRLQRLPGRWPRLDPELAVPGGAGCDLPLSGCSSRPGPMRDAASGACSTHGEGARSPGVAVEGSGSRRAASAAPPRTRPPARPLACFEAEDAAPRGDLFQRQAPREGTIPAMGSLCRLDPVAAVTAWPALAPRRGPMRCLRGWRPFVPLPFFFFFARVEALEKKVGQGVVVGSRGRCLDPQSSPARPLAAHATSMAAGPGVKT